jgi:predicted RNase H-like HicB family nuclease
MSKPRQFLVNLISDPEYKGYVADVPQLPGCMSQGKTVEAALKTVRKAIKVYLKDEPRLAGREIPDVLTSQVEVHVWPAWPEFQEARQCEPLNEPDMSPASLRAVT